MDSQEAEAVALAWGGWRVSNGVREEDTARYLSRGEEKSRKAATSSGMWFRARRVMTRRALSLAWGIWMVQRWWWMAWPILPTCSGVGSSGRCLMGIPPTLHTCLKQTEASGKVGTTCLLLWYPSHPKGLMTLSLYTYCTIHLCILLPHQTTSSRSSGLLFPGTSFLYGPKLHLTSIQLPHAPAIVIRATKAL